MRLTPTALWVMRRTFPGLATGPVKPYRVTVAGRARTIHAEDACEALAEGQRSGVVETLHEGEGYTP
jgi:hypothetical protein